MHPTHCVAMNAHRLRFAREQAGLSVSQAAPLLALAAVTLSEAEAGQCTLSGEHLVPLARLYGVSVAWLMGAEAGIPVAARQLAKLHPQDQERLRALLSALTAQEAHP